MWKASGAARVLCCFCLLLAMAMQAGNTMCCQSMLVHGLPGPLSLVC
jgi:hypothetical protein